MALQITSLWQMHPNHLPYIFQSDNCFWLHLLRWLPKHDNPLKSCPVHLVATGIFQQDAHSLSSISVACITAHISEHAKIVRTLCLNYTTLYNFDTQDESQHTEPYLLRVKWPHCSLCLHGYQIAELLESHKKLPFLFTSLEWVENLAFYYTCETNLHTFEQFLFNWHSFPELQAVGLCVPNKSLRG